MLCYIYVLYIHVNRGRPDFTEISETQRGLSNFVLPLPKLKQELNVVGQLLLCILTPHPIGFEPLTIP